VVSLPVPASDPDGDGLTWSATGLPDGLSVDPATGVISGTITYDASDSAPYTAMVTATDDGDPSLWTTVVFAWDVADTNRAPSITAVGDQGSAEGETV